MVERVIADQAAKLLIAKLKGMHGPLMFQKRDVLASTPPHFCQGDATAPCSQRM